MDQETDQDDLRDHRASDSPVHATDGKEDAVSHSDPSIILDTLHLSSLDQIQDAMECEFTMEMATAILLRLRQAYNEKVEMLYRHEVVSPEEEEESHRKIKNALKLTRMHREEIKCIEKDIPHVQSKVKAAMDQKIEMQGKLEAETAKIKRLSQEVTRERLQSLEFRAEKMSQQLTDRQAAICALEDKLKVEKELHFDKRNTGMSENEQQAIDKEFRRTEKEFSQLERNVEKSRAERDELIVELIGKEAEIEMLEEAKREADIELELCTERTITTGSMLSTLKSKLRHEQNFRDKMKRLVKVSTDVGILVEKEKTILLREIKEENQLKAAFKKEFARVSTDNRRLEDNRLQMKDKLKNVTIQYHANRTTSLNMEKDLNRKISEFEVLDMFLRTRINEWEFCLTRLQKMNRSLLKQIVESRAVESTAAAVGGQSVGNNCKMSNMMVHHRYLLTVHDNKTAVIGKLQLLIKDMHTAHGACRHELSLTTKDINEQTRELLHVDHWNSELEKHNQMMQFDKSGKEETLTLMQSENQSFKDSMKVLESQVVRTINDNKGLRRKKRMQIYRLHVIETQMRSLLKELEKEEEMGDSLESRRVYLQNKIRQSKEELLEKDALVLEIRRQRNLIGASLISKTKEFDLASKYLSGLEYQQELYSRQYLQNLDSLHLLKRQYGQLRNQLERLLETNAYHETLKSDYRTQCQELTKLGARYKALQECKMVRLHRWHYLKAFKPDLYALYEIIHAMQTRLRRKTHDADALRRLLYDRDKFLTDMRKLCASRESGVELGAKTSTLDDKCQEQSRRIQKLTNDLKESQCAIGELQQTTHNRDMELNQEWRQLALEGFAKIRGRKNSYARRQTTGRP